MEQLPLAAWATERRQDLLALLDQLNEKVETLTAAVRQEAERRPETQLLMTHPGMGPVTALAFVLIIGYPERFQCGKQIGSYIGLIPEEDSSGERRRLGHISKQAVLCCVSCWWRQHNRQLISTLSGAANSFTWQCDATAGSRRWRWRVS